MFYDAFTRDHEPSAQCIEGVIWPSQVPKSGDVQHCTENLPDVLGAKKQVSYKTEIIGGVPIITPTQVSDHSHGFELR